MTGYLHNGMQILHRRWNYEKARWSFLPVVTGFTALFWVFNGMKGALVGFLYGVIAGVFLIHESLPGNKK